MSCLDKVIVPPSNCTATEDDSSGCAADGGGGGATLVDYVLIGCGIFLGTLGSVLINLGNNMQALAMHRVYSIKAKARWAAVEDRLPIVGKDGQITSVADAAMAATPLYNDETLATLRRWRRVKAIGTFIFLFGSIVNFAAFAFAAASVLAPLEAVQFITNLVFGKCVHGHKISRKMKIGSVLTAIGTIIAVACGPMSVYEFDIDDLMCFWEDLPWILYVVLAYSSALGIMLYWYLANRQLERSLEVLPVSDDSSGMLPTHVPEGAPRPWRHSLTLLPVAYALSSALVGTQSVVQAKCLSEIVSMLVSGKAAATASSWLTYFVAVYFILTVAFWLYRLNDALGKYETLFIIPLLQASYIVLATVAGGIYFQEFATLAWWQFLAFFSGIAVMFAGLLLLIPPNPETTLEMKAVMKERRHSLKEQREQEEQEEKESRDDTKRKRSHSRDLSVASGDGSGDLAARKASLSGRSSRIAPEPCEPDPCKEQRDAAAEVARAVLARSLPDGASGEPPSPLGPTPAPPGFGAGFGAERGGSDGRLPPSTPGSRGNSRRGSRRPSFGQLPGTLGVVAIDATGHGLADSEAGASPRGGALYPPRSVHPSSGPSPGGSHGNSQGTLGLPRSQPRSRRSSREISKDHIAPSRGAGGSSDSVLGPVSETSLRSSLDDQLADLPPLRALPPKSPSLARASPLPEVGARASPVPEVGAGGATPPPCARFPRVVESSRKGLSAFSSEAQHERSDAGDGGGGTRALPPIFPQAGLDAAKP